MKTQYKVFFMTCFLFLVHSFAYAAINLPWSTTFDYAPCSQQGAGGETDCAVVQTDGIRWNWAGSDTSNPYTHASLEANYPGGEGGGGLRQWKGSGSDNRNTGPVRIEFDKVVKEIWIRWYQRYEKGFEWKNGIGAGTKEMYPQSLYKGEPYMGYGYGGKYRVANQSTGLDQKNYSGSKGWDDDYPGGVSDGSWHCYEVYLKSETDKNNPDGIIKIWRNGELIGAWDGVNLYNNEPGASQNGMTSIALPSNQKDPGLDRWYYLDIDDIVIYNNTPSNTDAHGNPFIGPIGYSGTSDSGGSTDDGTTGDEPAIDESVTSDEPVAGLLFEESFEDGNFSQRGWYDNISPVLSSSETTPGSTKSLELHFPSGATKPTAGGAMRKKFDETDSVYVSYDVKYSDNWQGSNRNYHPHEFYLTTNKDGDWTGLAYTHLTAYIEQNQLQPALAIQDGINIDQNNIGNNLVGETEIRGVAGCNGTIDDGGNDICYLSGGGLYNNWKSWIANSPLITTGKWYKVEAYFKLNSISNGIGVADGILQYRLNGELIINQSNVIFRTGEHSDMKFNQFIIAPWIGDGSPVDQTFWVDNLTVATAMPDMPDNTNNLGVPTNLRVISSTQ